MVPRARVEFQAGVLLPTSPRSGPSPFTNADAQATLASLSEKGTRKKSHVGMTKACDFL